jgi:hypothetical protein
MFFKTQRTPTQTDTTILSVYSLSLVTIITGHLILTKNSTSERFVHFFERERQSDSPRKTSTLRCQMQDLLSTSIVEKEVFFKLNDNKCRGKIFFSLLVLEGVIIDSRTEPRSRISLLLVTLSHLHPAARQFCRSTYTITDITIK